MIIIVLVKKKIILCLCMLELVKELVCDIYFLCLLFVIKKVKIRKIKELNIWGEFF